MIYRVKDQLAWGSAWALGEGRNFADSVLNVGIHGAYVVGGPYRKVLGENKKYKELYFDDFDPFPVDKIKEAIRFIDDEIKAGRKVYVHCMEGNSRSFSVVAAYLVYTGMTPDEAFAEMIRIKPFWTVQDKPVEPTQIRHWVKRDIYKYVPERE